MYHIIWTGNILQYISYAIIDTNYAIKFELEIYCNIFLCNNIQNYVSYNLNWKYIAIYSYAIIAKLCII